jgi:hypothetical protein
MNPNPPTNDFTTQQQQVPATGGALFTPIPQTPPTPYATQDNQYNAPVTGSSVKFPGVTNGELGFSILEVPETPAQVERVETIAIPEQITQIETLRPETMPVPTISQQQQPQQDKALSQIAQATVQQQPPQVVNKTNEVPALHHVHTGDQLTLQADKDEEEFIKKVEAAHGHQ